MGTRFYTDLRRAQDDSTRKRQARDSRERTNSQICMEKKMVVYLRHSRLYSWYVPSIVSEEGCGVVANDRSDGNLDPTPLNLWRGDLRRLI